MPVVCQDCHCTNTPTSFPVTFKDNEENGFGFRRMKCCHGVEDVCASACVCKFWDSSDLWVPNGDCAALEIHIDTSVGETKRFFGVVNGVVRAAVQNRGLRMHSGHVAAVE